MILLPQKVAYRGTLTGLRISAVDGTAFLDNCAALVPYADGNHLIEIYDATGNVLKGYLGAVGDGEDLGEELIDTWTNNGFETLTLSGSDITQAVNSTGSAIAYKETAQTIGMMTKLVIAVYSKASGTSPSYHPGASTKELLVLVANGGFVVNSANTWYRTVTGGTFVGFRRDAPDVCDFTATGISLKQVTAPSTAGCLIVSTKGGAVPNFAYKNTSFNYNEATNYVVVRKAR